ncbi:MAG TPA: hypothetical protein VF554_01405 [Thermoanaerobaculia bacterium]
MNVKGLFGRKKLAEPPAVARDIPEGDERRGPVPPPPRTAHAPGVMVYAFDAIPSQSLLRLGEGCGGFFLEGEEGMGGTAALLVLSRGGSGGGGATASPAAAALPPPSPGDVLLFSPSYSFEEISRTPLLPHRHIGRDGVAGAAFPGITGLRVLARLPEAGLAVLRLGPPPGARWVFRGVRAFAVFSGRFAAYDGDHVKEVRAGALARITDPSATLYLEAGNDAALAVALAADDFIAALG